MIQSLAIENLVFVDIETVPMVSLWEELPEAFQKHWIRKSDRLFKEQTPKESFEDRGGIYAEFGKIICISIGFAYTVKNEFRFRVKSFIGDEKKILQDFTELMAQRFSNVMKFTLCGHNIKEFDIPYLSRRMMVNHVTLPPMIDLSGMKPWEVPHLDTMQLWKFGDYKNFTSLDLLAAVLNIPTPKDDISGADVSSVFYQDNDIERISKYCQKDVVTLAQIILQWKNKPLLKEDQIEYV